MPVGTLLCNSTPTPVKKETIIEKETNSEKQKNTSQWQSKFVKNTLIIVSGIVVFVLAVIMFTNGSITQTGNVLNTESASKTPVCRTVQTPYESQEEYMKTEYYTETVPYTDRVCETKNLIYSITDFTLMANVCDKKIEECTDYTFGICTSKTTYCIGRSVACSLILNNLDDESGSWTIGFKFFKQGSTSIDATDTVSKQLYPRASEKIIGGTDQITTKDPLNTLYTCTYQVTQTPTKQVCRDVIKYKDVQKERQVTAYRPVTKYTTEQKCD